MILNLGLSILFQKSVVKNHLLELNDICECELPPNEHSPRFYGADMKRFRQHGKSRGSLQKKCAECNGFTDVPKI